SVVFLSAVADKDQVGDLLGNNRQESVFGTKEQQGLLKFISKDKMRECITYVGDFAKRIDSLQEILFFPGSHGLSEEESRLIKLFARSLGGTRVVIRPLTEGLSDSKTIQLSIKQTDGADLSKSVAKLSTIDKVDDE